MSEPDLDRLVAQWLAEVEAAAADLPADQRAELLSDLREHISVARGDLAPETEAGVRTILERLGDPAVIAAEARGDRPPALAATAPVPDQRRSRTGWIVVGAIAAVVLCLGGCVLAGLGLFATRSAGPLEGVPEPIVTFHTNPTPNGPEPAPSLEPSPSPSPSPPAVPSPGR